MTANMKRGKDGRPAGLQAISPELYERISRSIQNPIGEHHLTRQQYRNIAQAIREMDRAASTKN